MYPPDPAPEPTPAAAEVPIAGQESSWHTSVTEGNFRGQGLMLLRRTGSPLAGNQGMFPALPGMPAQIELTGTGTAADVAGSWSGLDGASGTFEWTFAADGSSFIGRWRAGATGAWAGMWTGARISLTYIRHEAEPPCLPLAPSDTPSCS